MIKYPEKLVYEPSKRTPWIILEPGKIFLMGRSIPENPGDFYRPIFDWISLYSKDYTKKTKIDMGFEYINTSSTKWVFTILKELAEMKDHRINMSITWYYEHGDEDISELGYIIRSLVDCPFNIIEVADMSHSTYQQILSRV
jgi:hypothetical protein